MSFSVEIDIKVIDDSITDAQCTADFFVYDGSVYAGFELKRVPFTGTRTLDIYDDYGSGPIWSGTYSLDTWYNCRIEYDGSTLDFYVDDDLKDSASAGGYEPNLVTVDGAVDYSSPTVTFQCQWDNFSWSVNGDVVFADDFSDGDLDDWSGYGITEGSGVLDCSITIAGSGQGDGHREHELTYPVLTGLLHIFTGYKAGHLMRAWEV